MVKTLSLIKVFSALGDPTRYKIVRLLSERRELCVSELAAAVEITPAGASQHLSVLEGAGILRPYRAGKKMCYEISDDKTHRLLLNLIKEEKV